MNAYRKKKKKKTIENLHRQNPSQPPVMFSKCKGLFKFDHILAKNIGKNRKT